jgi:hypothetical protein
MAAYEAICLLFFPFAVKMMKNESKSGNRNLGRVKGPKFRTNSAGILILRVRDALTLHSVTHRPPLTIKALKKNELLALD